MRWRREGTAVPPVAADLVVVVHFGFVLFVLTGGLLVLRWPWLAAVHVPAAAWGALIEFAGWVCPLTPLEKALRASAGQAGYSGGFVEHYVLPVLYPSGLTRNIQLVLGAVVIVLNLAVYTYLISRRRRQRRRSIGAGRKHLQQIPPGKSQ